MKADSTTGKGNDKLVEVQTRRKGVALFALLVLAIVVTLYVYIRREGKAAQSNP